MGICMGVSMRMGMGAEGMAGVVVSTTAYRDGWRKMRVMQH